MASKTTPGTMNGAGRRKLASWIESFVDYASNLESAPIYRRWAAITICPLCAGAEGLASDLRPSLSKPLHFPRRSSRSG